MVPIAGSKDTKETAVIKAAGQPAITQILQVNISLQSNKNTGSGAGAGRKNDDGTGKGSENIRKKAVYTVCTSLFLNNNEIRTLKGLKDILNYVVWQPNNLEWIDLSYNYLDKIDKELLSFPSLKALYLHGNYISNLEEVKKL
jgi:Leucine-rich repeat (LRR) protein